jgi:hypothetical protein
MTETEKTVRTPSAAYMRGAERRLLPMTLMGGTTAMRRAGETFLPREYAEDTVAYAARMNRTVLFNAFAKTVVDMVGRIFAKPVQIGSDVPAVISGLCDNVDLTGRDLNTFAYEVARDAMAAGVSFTLADMPPALPEGSTRADEIATGSRPYLVHVRAEDLIGWKTETINGREIATQIRILECVDEPDPKSPYEDAKVEQVRLIEIAAVGCVWTTYRKDGEGKWSVNDAGTMASREIPLTPVYFKRCGFFEGEPPLADLAELNLAHWQSSSDQRNILHVARVPILFGSGWDEKDTLTIGAGTFARATAADSKLVYVEHSGAAIDSGRNDLKDIEMQMLINKPAATATGEIRDDAKENSALFMMADALEDALEASLAGMGAYIGQPEGGSVNVNKEFGGISVGAVDQNTLLTMCERGLITHETLLREMQRRNVLADDFEPEEEARKLSAYDEADDDAAVVDDEDGEAAAA